MALSASTTAITLGELQASLATHPMTFVGVYKEDNRFNSGVSNNLREVWYDKVDDKIYVVVTRNL